MCKQEEILEIIYNNSCWVYKVWEINTIIYEQKERRNYCFEFVKVTFSARPATIMLCLMEMLTLSFSFSTSFYVFSATFHLYVPCAAHTHRFPFTRFHNMRLHGKTCCLHLINAFSLPCGARRFSWLPKLQQVSKKTKFIHTKI